MPGRGVIINIMKGTFCISKKLLSVIFALTFLLAISGIAFSPINYRSKAAPNTNSSLCPIDSSSMMTTKDCCNGTDKQNGFRCYLGKYSINCGTKKVTKCGCDNLSGRCLSDSEAFMPEYCNLYGKYLKPEAWQKYCCNNKDIETGRFKCVRTESSTTGFYKPPVYYQFHCNAQRYWSCKGGCDGSVCRQIIPSSSKTVAVTAPALPSSTPTPTKKPVTPIPTKKPSSTPTPKSTSTPLPAAEVYYEQTGSIYKIYISQINYGEVVKYTVALNLNPDTASCRNYGDYFNSEKYGFLLRKVLVLIKDIGDNLEVKVQSSSDYSTLLQFTMPKPSTLMVTEEVANYFNGSYCLN